MLFQHDRHHALVELINVETLLAVGSAFLLFFSEKVSADWLVDVGRMNSHVNPYFSSSWFDNMDISAVKRSYAARGRFAVFLGLTRDEHLLFYLGCKACLPGHLRDVVPHGIVSASVQSLVAQAGVSSKLVENGATWLPI